MAARKNFYTCRYDSSNNVFISIISPPNTCFFPQIDSNRAGTGKAFAAETMRKQVFAWFWQLLTEELFVLTFFSHYSKYSLIRFFWSQKKYPLIGLQSRYSWRWVRGATFYRGDLRDHSGILYYFGLARTKSPIGASIPRNTPKSLSRAKEGNKWRLGPK